MGQRRTTWDATPCALQHSLPGICKWQWLQHSLTQQVAELLCADIQLTFSAPVLRVAVLIVAQVAHPRQLLPLPIAQAGRRRPLAAVGAVRPRPCCCCCCVSVCGRPCHAHMHSGISWLLRLRAAARLLLPPHCMRNRWRWPAVCSLHASWARHALSGLANRARKAALPLLHRPPPSSIMHPHLCNLLAHRLGALQDLGRWLQHAPLKLLDITKHGGQQQVVVGVLQGKRTWQVWMKGPTTHRRAGKRTGHWAGWSSATAAECAVQKWPASAQAMPGQRTGLQSRLLANLTRHCGQWFSLQRREHNQLWEV